MLGVDANHAHHTLAVNHLALITNLFDGRTYLHRNTLDLIYTGKLCGRDSNRRATTQPTLDHQEES